MVTSQIELAYSVNYQQIGQGLRITFTPKNPATSSPTEFRQAVQKLCVECIHAHQGPFECTTAESLVPREPGDDPYNLYAGAYIGGSGIDLLKKTSNCGKSSGRRQKNAK